MIERNVRWDSLWHRLLTEAAIDASRLREPPNCRAARVAAIIVVTRSAWDAYINELIEVRSIANHRQRRGLNFYSKIEKVFTTLGYSEPSFQDPGVWADLEVTNTLRNKIVHELARPYKPGSGPHDLLMTLRERGLPSSSEEDLWERRVLVPWTARWCLRVTGTAVIELESLPEKRKRSMADVRDLVRRALAPLSQHN